MTTVLDKGQLKKTDTLQDGHLKFPSSKDFFSLPANLIPGLSGVSGGRVLLGSKAALQAVSLVDRQAPLVQSSANRADRSFHDVFGNELLTVRADQSGTVTAVSNDEVIVKGTNGKLDHIQLYNNFNMGRKTFIHHDVKVAVGQKVKKGDIIATSNYTDDRGQLALGTNLRTAVMPYRSGNFEDAWVVTESGANKLKAQQLIKVRMEAVNGIAFGKSKYISLFPNRFTNQQLANISDNGVVKLGAKLRHGDPVILAVSPKALKSTDIQLGRLSKVLKNAFKDEAETWHYEHDGEVVDVSANTALVTVQVKTVRGLAVGDKVSNAWGAKGVVGAIIPDTQAPVDKENKPVDILLNSMSITSRVAPALAVTMGLGKLAQQKNKPLNISHFTEGSSIQKVIDTLKKHNISDTETLYDPVSGRNIDVMVGPLYFTRLAHIAEDKQSSRSQGIGYSWDMQPAKSEEESSKRIGNLGTTALLSHGATAVLRDIATIKSTKNDEFWRALKTGQSAPTPKVPFVFNKFVAMLEGAGVKVNKSGSKFNILPLTDKNVLATSSGPINSPLMFKLNREELEPEDGGLFDPKHVGVLGEKYNHVDLNFAVPNPISEDFLRKLLGVTKAKYLDMICDGTLKAELAKINVDAKIEENRKYLRTGKKTNRDNAVKVLGFLYMLKKNGMKPIDLIQTKIPIIPAQYRPAVIQGDTTLSADVNNLYKDLILNNNTLKKTNEHTPADVLRELKEQQYASVKAVYGLGDPVSAKNQEKGLKGLLSTALGIRGGSAKQAMFQSKVVNKPLDLVARAVLTPDAKLDLDEASVPQDILWKTYLPFVVRRMVQKGIPASKAAEYAKLRNPVALQSLNEELLQRPGILSRDPSLHKFNLTGFYLKANPNPKDKTLKLNPLVFKSFNADNDGDQLNINVPAGEEARQEVIAKMLPSRNLLSPKTFSPIYMPSNEAALGLYQASSENNHNSPKKFANEAAVLAAFHRGELAVGDNVEIG